MIVVHVLVYNFDGVLLNIIVVFASKVLTIAVWLYLIVSQRQSTAQINLTSVAFSSRNDFRLLQINMFSYFLLPTFLFCSYSHHTNARSSFIHLRFYCKGEFYFIFLFFFVVFYFVILVLTKLAIILCWVIIYL